MAKYIAVFFGAMFLLTAGALGVAVTALVFLLATGREIPKLAFHETESPSATTPAELDPWIASEAHALNSQQRVESLHRQILRDSQVAPASHVVRAPQLLPMILGAGESIVATAPLNAVGPTAEIKFTLTGFPETGSVTVTVESVPPTQLTSGSEPVTVDLSMTAEGGIAVSRPGRFNLVATFTAPDGKPRTVRTTQPVTVNGTATSNLTIESLEFKAFSDSSTVYRYLNPRPNQSIRLPRSANSLTVKLTGTSGTRLELRAGSDDTELLGAADGQNRGDVAKTITADSLPTPGRYRLYVVDLWSTGQRQYDVAAIEVPDRSVALPVADEASNHAHVQVDSIHTPEILFNRYLQLRGYGLTPQGTLSFPVFVESTDSNVFIYTGDATGRFSRETNSYWNVELKTPAIHDDLRTILSDNNQLPGRILVRLNDGNFAYSATPISIANSSIQLSESDIPTISTPANPEDVQSTNATSETVSGSHTISSDVEHHRVVAIDVTGNVVAASEALAAATDWNIVLDGLRAGDNQFRFAYSLGNQVSSRRTPPVTFRMQTGGPTVVGVEPPNFGTAPGVQELVVRFDADHPLEKSNADYEPNYVLIGSNGTGVFSRATDNKHRPTTAVHNKSTNAVTLTFEPLPADIYQLRINAHDRGAIDPLFLKTSGETLSEEETGIRDTFGNYLAGNSGDTQTDYVHVMSKPASVDEESQFGLAGRLSDVAGIPDTTGPPVDYQEYTEPREYADGFNPSDKVVSRVARLYYFRDAHRVAQIINRRSKSFNRHNSTMARQLADQARLFAQETVDDRRSAERQAVEAASQARQAENSLATLQQALVKARNESTRLGGQVTNQQSNVRQLENALTDAESRLTQLRDDPDSPDSTVKAAESARTDAERRLADARDQLQQLESQRDEADSQVTLQEQRINATLSTIESLREQEVQDRETMERAQAKEDRAVDRQFRLEVAAAKEDPDTYAPGIPDSDDPVAQVTLSVIGEGVIQLRGPLKGVNIVRTMINQIDSPVGQVRVGIHTVQVNGERGDRMEHVVGTIQRYIDHSRFLTSQSAQMLRNAVVYVASMKAQQFCPDFELGIVDQSLGSQRYQDAFFGQEFMNELRAMDSEFLKTNNKLLSLHSMDSTSLASALFLLGLASNETRHEILAAFYAALEGKLPLDEMEYYEASDAGEKRRFQLLTPHSLKTRPFRLLADNARFVSFRGYFDHDVVGNDTLNPVQREFIRLAQIFKSRLITEIELKQRVVERALIEERIGDYRAQLKQVHEKEAESQRAFQEQQQRQREEQIKVLNAVQQVRALSSVLDERVTEIEAYRDRLISPEALPFSEAIALEDSSDTPLSEADAKIGIEDLFGKSNEDVSVALGIPLAVMNQIFKSGYERAFLHLLEGDVAGVYEAIFATQVELGKRIPNTNPYKGKFPKDVASATSAGFVIQVPIATGNRESIRFVLTKKNGSPATKAKSIPESGRGELGDHLTSVVDQLEALFRELKQNWSLPTLERSLEAIPKIRTDIEAMRQPASGDAFRTLVHTYELVARSARAARDDARQIEEKIEEVYSLLTQQPARVTEAHEKWARIRNNYPDQLRSNVDKAFETLVEVHLRVQFSQADAEAARRPLDHKKFLDLLIDETEEKFIELVEGTRAHTAVMDDYIKRIATALEDDFNTQFYEPAFRNVREQTYSGWDVQMGQIEHTSVLTNNREFAKVLPQATMEFDLPKRDIVIKEALDAAQAAYSDYGALMADPNFLALTKMYSGQPTSSPFSGNGVTPLVRDVLPGLPSQTDESLLIQAETGQPELASQLEALIPDPAIYKFETGTGFEIRPVIQPDGQSVVFNLNYQYTTNIREPVRADEKHLGRIKRHFVNTDVQIGNYELREVSRYRVALKASRTSRGVPLLEDIPLAGALFRPLPQDESSLQQNVILAHTVIYPTLFDLMGLRWAPAVADLDSQQLQEQEFVFRNRMKTLKNEVYDYSSYQVDEFLRIPEGQRRYDLYRTQETIPQVHPNGYNGPGLDRRDGRLREGYTPEGTSNPSMGVPLQVMPGNSAPKGSTFLNVPTGSTVVYPNPPPRQVGVPAYSGDDTQSLPPAPTRRPLAPPAPANGPKLSTPEDITKSSFHTEASSARSSTRSGAPIEKGRTVWTLRRVPRNSRSVPTSKIHAEDDSQTGRVRLSDSVQRPTSAR